MKMTIDRNDPKRQELIKFLDEIMEENKPQDAMKKTMSFLDKHHQMTMDTWDSWDRQTKIICLNDLISEVLEEIWMIERRMVSDDICRRCLTNKESKEGIGDMGAPLRKRGALEALRKKREELLSENSPKTRRPGHLKLIHSR